MLWEEREIYYHHRQKAKSHPDKIACVIIDGMDQMKLMIPQMINQMKAYASAWRLKTHLTGVLNHGRETIGYFDINQWPHDSNLTINILLHVLSRMTTVPDRLYLQMDNCWRENKNQFVLTFLAVLVHLDIFKKVKINFLMKGHTHEDCDQLFSRYGVKLSTNNVVTVQEMMSLFVESYTPSPFTVFLQQMYDVKEWLCPVNAHLHNISNPHVFLIEKNPKDTVILRYKNWSRDPEWKPDKDSSKGIPILKQDVPIPTDVPNFVASSPDKVDLERLKRDIPKFLDNSRIVTEEHLEWWNHFFENADEVYGTGPPKLNTWLLDDLKAKKVNLNATQHVEAQNETHVQVPPGVPEDVTQIVTAQLDDIPEVYTGPYRKPSNIAEVDNLWEHVTVGALVAVRLENYDKVPVIGKVIEKGQATFKMHYFKGSWNKKWVPWFCQNKDPWVDDLPKECIFLAAFELNENGKLQVDTKRQIREFYTETTEKH